MAKKRRAVTLVTGVIYRISNVSFTLEALGNMTPDPYGDIPTFSLGNKAKRLLAKSLGISESCFATAYLVRKSIDARKKNNVHFVATVDITCARSCEAYPAPGVAIAPNPAVPVLTIKQVRESFLATADKPPLVVGSGPAGLFCALILARAGLNPILIEQGAPVDQRVCDVAAFNETGELDVYSNIQFGEGGAGTFSDGKLNTGTKSPHIRAVLELFVQAGAPASILIDAKPHIGTDKLVGVVRRLREQIIEEGGQVRFYTHLKQLMFDETGAVCEAVFVDTKTGCEHVEAVSTVVLACGHSARQTFRMLADCGVHMQRKPFAVGVRIEHPQTLIDRAQYGSCAGRKELGAADYKYAVHLPDGRGVYTFCMCPGGEVVAASSEEGGVCTNGMSRHCRDGVNANSAVLVEVHPDDLPGNDALEGIVFQRSLEQRAYEVAQLHGARTYGAPAQRVGSFLGSDIGDTQSDAQGAQTEPLLCMPTYPRGVVEVDLGCVLPPFVTDALKQALPQFDRKLAGFAHPGAWMTAVEARSSSPVRIVRDASFQALIETDLAGGVGASVAQTGNENGVCARESTRDTRIERHSGLFPCGEGAGYAGGIMSAAVDGIRTALALIDLYDDTNLGESKEE